MTVEEKAKRYIKGIASAYKEDAEIDFTAGYTQAVTDLSAENEKLREALRELVDDIEERGYGECFEYLLPKAKQLITEP